MNRHAQRLGRPEGVFEDGELRVGVHQHAIEVLVGDSPRLVVVRLLLGAEVHQNVADARQHERSGLPARFLEQRQELARKLAAAERKELDEHHLWSRGVERAQDGRPAPRLRLVH